MDEWETLYESGGCSFNIRKPGWPPRKVEEAVTRRLPEAEAFFVEGQETERVSITTIFPDIVLSRGPCDDKYLYKVSAPRPSGAHTFTQSTVDHSDPKEAIEDARRAMAEYPAYLRGLMSRLLENGIDVQDLADGALAESVMEP